MALRYIEKFEDQTGATSYVFSLKAYEWQSQQPLRVASTPSIGADFAYDPLRYGAAPMDLATEHLRHMVVQASATLADAEIDTMKQKLLAIGRGKLWTLDSGGTRRWAWARLVAMPQFTINVPSIRQAPVSLEFRRYSPWFKQTAESLIQAVVASPTAFVVNNPGNIPAKFMTIRFRATGAAGMAQPLRLVNTTNNYEFTSIRSGTSANSVLKVDTERSSVQYANNDNVTVPADDAGVTYADDFANFTIGPVGSPTQVGFMRLEPGNNSFSYTSAGTPALSIEFAFYAPYA